MADFEREKSILEQLTQARDAIRRKHQLLKTGKANLEKTLNETFKPVVDPLKKLVEATTTADDYSENHPAKRKKITFEKVFNTNKRASAKSNKKRYLNSTAISDMNDCTIQPLETSFESAIGDEFDQDDDDDDDDENDSLSISKENTVVRADNISTEQQQQLFNDSISRDYIRLLHDSPDNKKKLDKTFGVKIKENGYFIGNTPINFENDKVTVNDEAFTKTLGLMELLFHKEPNTDLISSSDQSNYMKIMNSTNAHRIRCDPHGDYRNKSVKKFKTFIRPNLSLNSSDQKRKGGKGLLPPYKIARKDTSFDYVYWDDPNELVDRLRLLIAEQAAGNPSHVNEIYSIIEELREAGYIY